MFMTPFACSRILFICKGMTSWCCSRCPRSLVYGLKGPRRPGCPRVWFLKYPPPANNFDSDKITLLCYEYLGLCCESFAFAVNILVCTVSYLLLL